jgi:hypothetical protein
MAYRKKAFKIPGVSFSLNRALGITKAKRRFARATGIPTSKAGIQHKVGRMASGGCLLSALGMLAALTSVFLFVMAMT